MFNQFLQNSSTLPTDIIILVVLFIIFFAYALYFGKSRIIALIISFYPAAFLYEHFPYASKLMFLHGDQMIILNKCLIFLLFLIPLDIIIGRFVFTDSGYGSAHYFRTAGFALVAVVLALLFSFSIINLGAFHTFSPTINGLFKESNIFWWTIAPLIIMFFL